MYVCMCVCIVYMLIAISDAVCRCMQVGNEQVYTRIMWQGKNRATEQPLSWISPWFSLSFEVPTLPTSNIAEASDWVDLELLRAGLPAQAFLTSPHNGPQIQFFRILHRLCRSSAFEKQQNTANTSNLPIVIQVQHSPTLIKEPSKRVSCGTSRQARGSGGTRIPSDWGNDDLQLLGFGMSRSSAGQ